MLVPVVDPEPMVKKPHLYGLDQSPHRTIINWVTINKQNNFPLSKTEFFLRNNPLESVYCDVCIVFTLRFLVSGVIRWHLSPKAYFAFFLNHDILKASADKNRHFFINVIRIRFFLQGYVYFITIQLMFSMCYRIKDDLNPAVTVDHYI